MKSESADQLAAAWASLDGFLAGHADREHLIGLLKAAFTQGLLTKGELDRRVSQAFAARTFAELAAITADLPAAPASTQPAAHVATPAETAAAWSMGAAFLAVTLTAAAMFLRPGYFVLVAGIIFMVMVATGGQLVFSQHQRRSGRQLPPGGSVR
jgi:hypothetical protein